MKFHALIGSYWYYSHTSQANTEVVNKAWLVCVVHVKVRKRGVKLYKAGIKTIHDKSIQLRRKHFEMSAEVVICSRVKVREI